jgi:hypothetical protein
MISRIGCALGDDVVDAAIGDDRLVIGRQQGCDRRRDRLLPAAGIILELEVARRQPALDAGIGGGDARHGAVDVDCGIARHAHPAIPSMI